MSKAGLIALLGFVLAVMPFLGIPTGAKTLLSVVGGLLILALGFLVREERRWLMRALKGDHQTDAYTENGAQGYGQKISEAHN
ncbi:MAG: hypothetical protein AAB439_01680 [Patescibacteria group bacterium]